MRKFPYQPSKRLGQNFLRDSNIIKKVVDTAQLSQGDIVLEPGSGYGTVTSAVLDSEASKILAVEKDRRLADHLRVIFRDEPRVEIIEGDVLKTKIPTFNKIVGTPAYNISSRLTLLMIEREFELASIVFQVEFGNRLVAKPGTSNYGRLSVMSLTSLDIEKITKIPKTAFKPRPRVDSILLKVRKLRSPRPGLDYELFRWVVRESFTQRKRLMRGALRHALDKALGGTALADHIMSRMTVPMERVFQVAPEAFQKLSVELSRVLLEYEIDRSRLLGNRGNEEDSIV